MDGDEVESDPHGLDAFANISAFVGPGARARGIELSPSFHEHR